jgi:hypothetical protein
MATTRYGYILSTEGSDPAVDRGAFAIEGFTASVISVGSLDEAYAAAQEFMAEDIDLIDFCGDFDAVKLAPIVEMAAGRVQISYADFFPEQLKMLDTIDMSKFAHIIMADGLEPDRHQVIINLPVCEMKIIGVGSVEAACEQVQLLTRDGFEFIELSSAFDTEKTKAVIEAAGGKAAIGSAGIA